MILKVSETIASRNNEMFRSGLSQSRVSDSNLLEHVNDRLCD